MDPRRDYYPTKGQINKMTIDQLYGWEQELGQAALDAVDDVSAAESARYSTAQVKKRIKTLEGLA